MDYLHRIGNSSYFKWKNPAKADLDNLKPESIVECHINGGCYIRKVLATVRNSAVNAVFSVWPITELSNFFPKY